MEEDRYGKNLFHGGWGDAAFRFSLFPFFEGENTIFHPHRAPHRRGDHRHSRRYASARSEQGAGDGIQDFLRQQHVLPREGLCYVHR